MIQPQKILEPDGQHVLMLAPGMRDYGEFYHNSNHQFGMMRAAAWLKAAGYNVTFVDAGLDPEVDTTVPRLKERHRGMPLKVMTCGNVEDEYQIKKYQTYYGKPLTHVKNEMAKAKHPDEVWVGSGLTYHWEDTAELVHIAQQMFPSTRVRVGGIYPTLCPDHAKKHCPGADIWEGPIPAADGFWPDYDIAPYQTSFRTIKSNTGCTLSVACSFCSVIALEPKFSFRDPRSVEDYVEAEMAKGVRTIRIWASQLLQPPQAFADMMDRLYKLQCKHKVRLRIYASEGIQPSLFTPDMAHRMVRAGFTHITIPMESIEPETLERFNKPSGLTDYHRAVQLAKEAGFSWIGAFIMIGTPQQKLDEIIHAVVDCWYRRISPILMKYTIVPGSQDWETDKWVHDGKGLEQLHPSLWCGEREDLRAYHLEEIVAITRMGYDTWRTLPIGSKDLTTITKARTQSIVDELFMKWCKIYGFHRNGRFLPADYVTPHQVCTGVEVINKMAMKHSFGHANVCMVT